MSGSGISWAICKSAPCSRQTTTPAPQHSVFYRSHAHSAAQPTASKHWRQKQSAKPAANHLVENDVCESVHVLVVDELLKQNARRAVEQASVFTGLAIHANLTAQSVTYHSTDWLTDSYLLDCQTTVTINWRKKELQDKFYHVDKYKQKQWH